MPPDDRATGFVDVLDTGVDVPVDADLESLEAELAAAGAHARRMLYGRSQPTRVFSNHLRARLLEAFEPEVTASGAAGLTLPRAAEPEHQPRPPLLISGETPPGGTSDRQATAQSSPATLRAILALLTIAAMAVLLAVGAFSGSFGPALP